MTSDVRHPHKPAWKALRLFLPIHSSSILFWDNMVQNNMVPNIESKVISSFWVEYFLRNMTLPDSTTK